MKTIAVIDYGMGNLRSVAKAVEHVAPAGTRVRVTDRRDEILEADRIVFPGQGAARDCMRALRAHGLVDVVREAVRNRPFLGICMGMQVLLDYSEENDGTECLGVFRGRVRFFGTDLHDADGRRLKIPHMGWNNIHQRQPHPLWDGIEQDSRFYFVHSYYSDPAEDDLPAGETEYGIRFTSAIARGNVFAIQAHPEKSAEAGLRLLRNFTRWNGME
ncbi:MAG: imidazole glycerol phosphate synthase subunit HisH [Gammaproteobacteria bacterium]|nr:MAG: imidazole glycerol phosphate synthase subunit HisH [Gammaproteobacteria bacterium]